MVPTSQSESARGALRTIGQLAPFLIRLARMPSNCTDGHPKIFLCLQLGSLDDEVPATSHTRPYADTRVTRALVIGRVKNLRVQLNRGCFFLPIRTQDYRTTCAVFVIGPIGQLAPLQKIKCPGQRFWTPKLRTDDYRTTCAVWERTVGQLAPFLSTGIGQLAPFGPGRYRTTCAECIGQLAPLGPNYRTTCAEKGAKLSDNLRQTIGQLAPFDPKKAVWHASGLGSCC